MSVEPDTPPDWLTITIQGRNADIGPESTAENVMQVVRDLINAKKLSVPASQRHRYTCTSHAVVRKQDVGIDEDGEWNPPESEDDIVSFDLHEVEEGDDLRVWGAPGDWHPVYPEATDG